MISVFALFVFFFFFKQKTAYEMRISDWSSDVCSSDLAHGRAPREGTCPACRLRADMGRRAEGGGKDRAVPYLLQIQPERPVRHVLLQLHLDPARKQVNDQGKHGHLARHRSQGRPRVSRENGRASCRERVCQYV